MRSASSWGQCVFIVSQAEPRIELKRPHRCRYPLCCHLDSIGFSKAGKSNALFKTNCSLVECASFPWCATVSRLRGHTRRNSRRPAQCQNGCCWAFLPSPTVRKAKKKKKTKKKLSISYGANYVWVYELHTRVLHQQLWSLIKSDRFSRHKRCYFCSLICYTYMLISLGNLARKL